MLRHKEDLLAALAAGQVPKYLFFWGHTEAPGRVTQACLSQWYPSSFTVDGQTYATAEHWMMAEKARLFGDLAACRQVFAAEHPGEAKRIGRGVQGFESVTWEAARFDIVVRGSFEKFRQNPELRAFLETTGERILVEASPRDRIWGIGLAAQDPRAENPHAWNGLNLLGFALMVARAQLLASDPPA
ncbi:MAG: NADAR family protein [Myxococcota bacterium]